MYCSDASLSAAQVQETKIGRASFGEDVKDTTCRPWNVEDRVKLRQSITDSQSYLPFKAVNLALNRPVSHFYCCYNVSC